MTALLIALAIIAAVYGCHVSDNQRGSSYGELHIAVGRQHL